MSARGHRHGIPRPPIVLAAVVLLAAPLRLRGDVSLPRIFGDNMVLQRDSPVPVWGRAAPDEEITVRFAGQEQRVRADADGRWRLTLDRTAASAAPQEMVVAGANLVRFQNILVGEVWLCAGQSNMEYAVGVAKPWAPPAAATDRELAEELAGRPLPALRLFRVEKQREPPEVVSAGWSEAAGAARDEFSAVGYCFARRLLRELAGPVGMIQAAWGGSRIEEWTPADAYARLATVLTGPAASSLERDPAWIGRNFDAMVQPLVPYALRGVIWYQGESNLIAYNDGLRYADKLRALIDSWRTAWQGAVADASESLPFYSVQIAPFRYTGRTDPLPHSAEDLPRLWEAQAAALRIPRTGLVPTTDLVDDVGDIHPAHKRTVGERLAALALNDTYGRKGLTWAGPQFAGLVIRGAEAVIHFKNTGAGLMSRDGKPLTDFEIAGADGAFVPATAVIRGSTVVVSSPRVPVPVAVRFGWSETARPNLMNRAGLPAYPFRSNAPIWPGDS